MFNALQTSGTLSRTNTDSVVAERPIRTATQRDRHTSQRTVINSTTGETVILNSGGCFVHNNLMYLLIANSSASTTTTVIIRDRAQGSARFTVTVNGQQTVPILLPAPFPQTTANQTWTAQCTVPVSSIFVTVMGVKEMNELMCNNSTTAVLEVDLYLPFLNIQGGADHYIDSNDTVWVEDNQFLAESGTEWIEETEGFNYENLTTLERDYALFDDLYNHFRRNSGATDKTLTYTLPIVGNGSYKIYFFCCNMYEVSAGAHVYSISLNGSPIFAAVDMFAESGLLKPYVKTAEFVVSNDASTIEVTFAVTTGTYVPMSAMQLAKLVAVGGDYAVVSRIKAGASNYTDINDDVWAADSPLISVSNNPTSLLASDAFLTMTDAVVRWPFEDFYNTQRKANLVTYDVPLTGNGLYKIEFFCCELTALYPGLITPIERFSPRNYRITVKANTIFSQVDMLTESGYRTPYIKTHEFQVTDGATTMEVTFRNVLPSVRVDFWNTSQLSQAAVIALTSIENLGFVDSNHYLGATFIDNINFAADAGNYGFDRIDDVKFALRFLCYIDIPDDGLDWYFYVESDDGARLKFDGVQILNDWQEKTMSETRSLLRTSVSEGLHLIILETFQYIGDSGCILRWSSSSTTKAIVPSSAFVSFTEEATMNAMRVSKARRVTYDVTKVRAGTTAFTDANNDFWTQDTTRLTTTVGDTALSTSIATLDLTDVGLWSYESFYRSQRRGVTLAYTLPIVMGNGTYKIEFFCCELLRNEVGYRVYDISLEGTVIFPSVDMVAESGFRKPYIKSHEFQITDGSTSVDVEFQRVPPGKIRVDLWNLYPETIEDIEDYSSLADAPTHTYRRFLFVDDINSTDVTEFLEDRDTFGENYFALRYTADLNIPDDGLDWTFYVDSDDGCRLWFDGVEIIDDDWGTGIGEDSAVVTSVSQGLHRVVLEFLEWTGGQKCIMKWSSSSTTKAAIPSSAWSYADGNAAMTAMRVTRLKDTTFSAVEYSLPLTAQATMLALSPTALWPLDETTGTSAFDYSGNGHNGTYVNGVGNNQASLMATSEGASSNFDGNNDRVDISTNAALRPTTSYSFVVWLNADTLTGNHRIMQIGADGFIRIEINSSNARVVHSNRHRTLSVIATGTTYMMAVTWDNTTIRMYLDGVEDTTSDDTGALPSNGGVFTLMRKTGGGAAADGWDGKAQMFGWWVGTVLTAPQIASIYAAGQTQNGAALP